MKGQRPRHKVIVFLVDGPSELNALSLTLSSLYDSIDPGYEVYFPPMTEDGVEHWGDLTSKYGINPDTIEKCIDKLYFKDFLKKQKLYPKDISEIIHILDMDGAYIPDEDVICGTNPTGADKVFYDRGRIITTNVDGIVERNRRKRENIDYLCSLDKIKIDSKSIPYSVYFFSSNLDHFLHNDANIAEGKEKAAKANSFALQYVDDPHAFVAAISSTPGALVDMSLEESWAFIRERGSHSIERHTNIVSLFAKLST